MPEPPVVTKEAQAPVPPDYPDVQAPIVIPIVISLKIVIDIEEKPHGKAVFTIGPVRQRI